MPRIQTETGAVLKLIPEAATTVPQAGPPPERSDAELIVWVFPSSQALVRMDGVWDANRSGKQAPILFSRGHGVDHHLVATFKNEDDGLQ